MNIGITYDLREEYLAMGYGEEETAEFDKPDTIEAIEGVLKGMGFRTDKIGHAKNLIKRLSEGERWDMVFNIAEGLYGTGREALVPALLDAYRIPYVFSGPLVLAFTLDKALAKTVVRAAGIPTPEYVVIREPEETVDIPLSFPLFAKPLAEGTGKGIDGHSVITSRGQLRDVCKELLERFGQPVLVERFVGGREFTAGIVGTGKEAFCVGVMEILLNPEAETGVYSYSNKEEWEEKVRYVLPDKDSAKCCADMALKVWRTIGAEDGGRVDIRFDEKGNPYFLEVNPLAGLHPTHSDLPILSRMNGTEYPELIGMIVKSALKKIRPET